MYKNGVENSFTIVTKVVQPIVVTGFVPVTVMGCYCTKGVTKIYKGGINNGFRNQKWSSLDE